MTNPLTDRQLKYLNILLTQCIGEYFRKQYLKHFYNVDSSKHLTKDQASEIIERVAPDNENREKNVAQIIEKINELNGQKKLL